MHTSLLLLLVCAPFVASVTTAGCNTDADCRSFSDSTATCTTSCVCTAPDTTPFCSAGSSATEAPFTFVLSFTVACDTFFTNSTVSDSLESAALSVTEAANVSASIMFSCGSLAMTVSGTMPIATAATIADNVRGAVEVAAVGTALEATITSASVRTSTSDCTVNEFPVTESVNIYNDGTLCVASACAENYNLTVSEATNYRAACLYTVVATPAPTQEDDDELPTAHVALIIMCVIVFIVFAGLAAFFLTKEKSETESETKEEAQNVENEPVV